MRARLVDPSRRDTSCRSLHETAQKSSFGKTHLYFICLKHKQKQGLIFLSGKKQRFLKPFCLL